MHNQCKYKKQIKIYSKYQLGFLLVDATIAIALLAIIFLTFTSVFSVRVDKLHSSIDAHGKLFSQLVGQVKLQSTTTNFAGDINQSFSTRVISENFFWANATTSINANIIQGVSSDDTEYKGCLLGLGLSDQFNQVTQSMYSVPFNAQITDIISDPNHLYVSLNSTSSSEKDFAVFDYNASSTLSLIGSLNTGPGISAITRQKNFIFAANISALSQVQVISIADQFNPIVVSSLKLFSSSTATVSPSSISRYKNNIFLGMKKSSFPEFSVIDTTNPYALVLKESHAFNSTVNTILSLGGKIFIGTPLSNELSIFNIEPNLSEIGGYDAPQGSGNGKSLTMENNMLFMGRTVGDKELFVLDVTDPAHPTFVSSHDFNTSIDRLVVSGKYVFVGGYETGKELQIYSYQNKNLTLLKTFSLGSRITALSCERNTLFAGVDNPSRIYSFLFSS